MIAVQITPLMGFMGLGPVELLVVGAVAVLLFGSRLPSVARSAGKSLTEFKRGMQDLQHDVRTSIETDEQAVAQNKSPDHQDMAGDLANEEKTPEEKSPEEEILESYPRPTSSPYEPHDA